MGWVCVCQHKTDATAQAIALACAHGGFIAVLVDGVHPDDRPYCARFVRTISPGLSGKRFAA
jgi:hypothetical protein